MQITRITLDEARQTARCDRCNRRIRKDPDPSIRTRAGLIVGWTCSRCHSPEDRAEIELNEAGIDYSKTTTDAFGRLVAPVKK